MMSDRDDKRPRRAGRGVKIALVVSLALNLLFVGLIVGAMARFGGTVAQSGGPSLGAALYRALPSEDRQMLRKGLYDRPRRGDAGEGARQHGPEVARILETLRAETFDPTALSALAAAQREQRLARGQAAQQAWLTRITEMDVAERRAYADRLEEVLEQPRRKRRWFGRPGE